MIVAKTKMDDFPDSCFKCKYAYNFDISTKYCVQTGLTITSKGSYKRMKHCPLVEVKNEEV